MNFSFHKNHILFLLTLIANEKSLKQRKIVKNDRKHEKKLTNIEGLQYLSS